MDNFLAKGLDDAVETQRENARQEKAELETVRAALGKEFPQQEELALARENHSAVIRELQRMQDDSSYVSTWTPKTSLTDEQPTTAEAPQPQEQNMEGIKEPSAEHIEALSVVEASTPEEKHHTIKYGEGDGRTEYTVSTQHNGHTFSGYMCDS